MITSELPSTLLRDTEFSVLDVETTGLSARNNRVIEIGIVKVKNLKITDKYTTLIIPDVIYHISLLSSLEFQTAMLNIRQAFMIQQKK